MYYNIKAIFVHKKERKGYSQHKSDITENTKGTLAAFSALEVSSTLLVANDRGA